MFTIHPLSSTLSMTIVIQIIHSLCCSKLSLYFYSTYPFTVLYTIPSLVVDLLKYRQFWQFKYLLIALIICWQPKKMLTALISCWLFLLENKMKFLPYAKKRSVFSTSIKTSMTSLKKNLRNIWIEKQDFYMLVLRDLKFFYILMLCYRLNLNPHKFIVALSLQKL